MAQALLMQLQNLRVVASARASTRRGFAIASIEMGDAVLADLVGVTTAAKNVTRPIDSVLMFC